MISISLAVDTESMRKTDGCMPAAMAAVRNMETDLYQVRLLVLLAQYCLAGALHGFRQNSLLGQPGDAGD